MFVAPARGPAHGALYLSLRERPELCGPRAVQARLHTVVLGSPVPTLLTEGRGLATPIRPAPRGARQFRSKGQVPTQPPLRLMELRSWVKLSGWFLTVKSLPPPNCPVHPGSPHTAARSSPPIPQHAARLRCTRLDRPSQHSCPCPPLAPSLTSASDSCPLECQINETSSQRIEYLFTPACPLVSKHSYKTPQ